MSARSATERKRDERELMRRLGYVLCQFWVHPKDRERVKNYIGKVMRARVRKEPQYRDGWR